MAKLGDMLVSEGLIRREQLDEALADQKARGGFLGDALLRKKLLTERQLVDVLARQTGFPTVDLATVKPDAALARAVPLSFARRFHCVPVQQTGKVLHVALADPEDNQAPEALAFQSGCTIKVMVATSQAIEAACERLYGSGARPEPGGPSGHRAGASRSEARSVPRPAGDTRPQLDNKALDQVFQESIDQFVETEVKREGEEQEDSLDLATRADDAPVIRLVNYLLTKAVRMRASDIHIEPQEKTVRVRFRVDGALVPVADMPGHTRQALVSRIKILSRMDIAERRVPQDGRLKVRVNESSTVDLRINVLPSIFGEKVVMRVLGQGQLGKSIDEQGFVGHNLELMREALRNPFGMILVTGPTGSGKTTTLYTILMELNRGDVNIVTAEEPVEYHLPGITQVNVRPSIGLSFDVVLRAFLRQDPDIILVGEMRDFETAAIATKAALTGHLVLSTLHTNDGPSTIVRLVDMGIEPYLVASAVKVVVAQRLVRRICPACKEEVPLDQAERQDISQTSLASIEHLFKGRGCEQCGGLGFKGRAAVYEVMRVKTKEMRRVITEGGTEIQVAQVARREGMRSLKDEALRMVSEGVTTIEEALKIIMTE